MQIPQVRASTKNLDWLSKSLNQKKVMRNRFLLCLLLFATAPSFAQIKETFDLATYTIPAEWKEVSSTAEVVSYAITDKQKGTYCQAGIYKSMATMGTALLDFQTDWTDLVAKPYHITAQPDPGAPTTNDGWTALSAEGYFDFNGSKSVAILLTLSGYGRRVSILFLTNTQDYNPKIDEILGSVTLQIQEESGNGIDQPTQPQNVSYVSGSFTFTTTTFDDGWVATAEDDWVRVAKGKTIVLIHYPNKQADVYNSVLMDGLKNAWNILVAPRYSAASNVEFKPLTNWEPIEFAEADMVEKSSGRQVHVVLFKKNYSNGAGKYIEFITPDKTSFEKEFGPYHESSSGWEKMENMAMYNKFAIADNDLQGKWSSDYSGAIQYVNAVTGFDAGMDTHASTENFQFVSGNTYLWDLSVASGTVGNIKFQNVKSNGNFSMNSNWQITFSAIEGKPRTCDAYFSCIKDLRVLWLDNKAFFKVQ